MFRPIKVTDLELSEQFNDVDLEEYQKLMVLVRLHGEPLGFITLPGVNGRCPAHHIRQTVLDQLSGNLLIAQLKNGLNAPTPDTALNLETLFNQPPPVDHAPWPLVTVAVCTRDRADNLAHCLDALERLDYENLDLLVIDNAPSNGETETLVKTHFPRVRYVCEPQPGLNWARNRAILEAQGEIIAFTDDDVSVDRGWVKALARLFLADEDVSAVTGLVVPYELETEAQQLFETYGGFARGFTQRWYRSDSQQPGETARRHGGTGKFGTGPNIAYRRRIFAQIGYFDVALDVGTVTNGGGDLDMFFRVLKEGHTLVYEPAAIVWHRHRRDYEKLKEQIRNNGIGFYAFLVRNWLAYPAERWTFFLLGVWWFGWWSLRRLVAFTLRPFLFPRELVWTELTGSLVGLTRYQQARRHAAAQASDPLPARPQPAQAQAAPRRDRDATAVRLLDLAHPIPNLDDVAEYRQVALYISRRERPLGQIGLSKDYHPLSALQLRQAIAEHLNVALLAGYNAGQPDLSQAEVLKALAAEYGPGADASVGGETAVVQLPPDIPISIVIATYDRPDDLRRCLACIQQQATTRPVETIVVDNNPDSQKTPAVVADFPQVVYVTERRKGLSYARNAGIIASSGEIIVCTDDDVSMPPGWLEKLVAPFARSDVMIVTGNVLPREIETRAQQLFELYGGLGKGFTPLEVGHDWFSAFRFKAVPTWRLGATANAAFRAVIFSDPRIGLMDEALGAGTPTGCSEDTYVFYRVLKAGYTLVYEPHAFVWHTHRNTYQALRRQLYSYSKGHVAYHLTTFQRDGDWRALFHIFVWLPGSHLWRIFDRLRRKSDYPLRLNIIEIIGNGLGPWALWRSRRKARRQGPSAPYVQPAQRQRIHRSSHVIQTES